MQERLGAKECPQDWIHSIKLAFFDFDGTIANTFEKPPGGVDVTRAYEIAMQEVFGDPALAEYQRLGGLRNRAPGEVVSEVLSALGLQKTHAISHARAYLLKHRIELAALAPGAEKHLQWDILNTTKQKTLLVELFVLAKLAAIMPMIGRYGSGPEDYWPKPFPGVLDLLDALRKRDVHLGILSSGHDVFIKKCFELWGRECPELLTDDRMRHFDAPREDKAKPSMLLPQLLHMLFARAHPAAGMARPAQVAIFGDGLKQDGGAAAAAKMHFGWFNPHPDDASRTNPNLVTDWNELVSVLNRE
jgi:FMN phosphatase YigB (HAD superfamily)